MAQVPKKNTGAGGEKIVASDTGSEDRGQKGACIGDLA